MMYFQQEIIIHLSIIALITLFGYLLIPAAGAFYVRHVWRRFRSTLLGAVKNPPLSYAALHKRSSELQGPFRFFGTIRAIQGNDRAWCSDGKLTVSVNLRGKDIYFLSSSYNEEEIYSGNTYPEEPPKRISWNRLTSLPEYTGIFISGMIEHREGMGMFVQNERRSRNLRSYLKRLFRWRPGRNRGKYSIGSGKTLFVIIYEQEDNALLRQAIWRGRQRNEYWNAFTPGSLVVGSFSLFFYFYLLMQNPVFHMPAVAALTLSISPLLPLFPPAVFFLLFYIRYWKRGRILRAERDLLRIPTLYFEKTNDRDRGNRVLQSCRLATGERYVMVRVADRVTAETLFPQGRFLHLSLSSDVLEGGFFLFGVDPERQRLKRARLEGPRSVALEHPGPEGENIEIAGGRTEELPEKLLLPKDPGAEGLIIPGDPFILSERCERRARNQEIFGLSLFCIGLALNVFITFVILGLIPI
ncbi:MAG: hypothetical protein ACOC2B_03525 [Sediminispirochaetaceae bacterium]